VGEELRHAFVQLLASGEIHDPDLAGAMVTVTEVRMSPDLRNANIFFTPLGGEGGPAILKALKHEGVSILVTTATRDLNVYKSSRNIEGVTVSPVADLNALAILTPKRMLVTKAALDALRERAKAGAAEAGA